MASGLTDTFKLNTPKTSKAVYSVKQVNSYIKQIFDGDFILRNLSVKGEVSNCKYHSSGHIYFKLKDGSAVISCVMFSSQAAALKFRLEDGMQIIVTGNVSVYETAGQYQLYVKRAEQEGQGDLFKKFEELKSRLEESGYFAPEYKRKIPSFAYRIGVVTSQTGAVIRDIFNVASRRNPYVQIFLYPAKVQGEGAAEQIAQGIRVLDSLGLDVIITGRGGGSIEDLWAFNEEIVAKAIFSCRTPVISAVGHETDFTIADFTADLRAPTPSAAAELAVFDYAAFEKTLADYTYAFKTGLFSRLEKVRKQTETYRRLLYGLSPERQLQQKMQRLDDCRSLLDACLENRLQSAKNRLSRVEEKPSALMNDRLKASRQHLALLSERLEGQSPLKRLQEGYAVVRFGDRALRSVKQVTEGDTVCVELKDGSLRAEITEILPKTEPGMEDMA